ncbi:uncharacterized protein JNUCC1_01795 [Lentibacillus sp. JNUCC-1]|uniref:bacillithiol system redox-active protein YtxJ n=1 Tax=Lentibacillus sp. JNUCC-1 TaxID=2654513 RepID=UPI0012E98929|nr:bacillithiol system redox-active protein YtxJ [Lentibacillus sp. JNUCC-1]MUV37987.1 uncharacterized protein [Lentibacillus sp. JNUCC-1]
MASYKELTSIEAYADVMENTSGSPVLLFKHSTTCPISAKAFEEFQSYLNDAESPIDAYLVKVIEDRPVSTYIAESTGVKHESPQIFLLDHKQVTWHKSHNDITQQNIEQAVTGA